MTRDLLYELAAGKTLTWSPADSERKISTKEDLFAETRLDKGFVAMGFADCAVS